MTTHIRLNALILASKALRHRPLPTLLNLLLMAVGIAMMTFVLSASHQLESTAMRDAQGIDLVVGAKGSPLQLILSSIYHVDVPTGNIPAATQAQLAQNPMIKKIIPLALGDSFNGFRIVGTDAGYIAHYGGTLAQGKLFDAPMQAVFGAQAAARSRAVVGATFTGSHGLAQGGGMHGNTPFTVVGILKPTGTVLDRLVLTSVESVWKMHEAEHASDHEEKTAVESERELTALLVQYASPLATLSMPRFINSQAGLQAAQPAFEAAKLFKLLGSGVDVLRAIAALVLLTAGLSMFVALYGALEERKTDLAILRALGAPPRKLLLLLLTEGLLLALMVALAGWALGHVAVEILGCVLSSDQNLTLSGWLVTPDEAWLVLVASGVGLVAAALPAFRAYCTDIAHTLAT